MIQVYRYMSQDEKQSVEAGMKVFNTIDWHRLRGTASTAHGMSFGIGDKERAVAASRYLKGVVDMRWLMTAQVDDGVLEPAKGRYPTKYDYEGNMLEDGYYDELCTEEYCIGDGHWHDVHFYPCRGIDLRTRLVIISKGLVTRRETSTLAMANSVAKSFRQRLISGIDFAEFMRYRKGRYKVGASRP